MIVMRVSLDSNVWERVVSSADMESVAVQNALQEKRFEGFICEAAFRIEAIPKKIRVSYFAGPHTSLENPGDVALIDGKPYLRNFSLGPDYAHHPGLPEV